MQQVPSYEELLKALDSAILDRQTMSINTAQGKACIIPIQDYIRLIEMKNTLTRVVTSIQGGDMLGVIDAVEVFSKWLLEGGGESYTLEGGLDARTM